MKKKKNKFKKKNKIKSKFLRKSKVKKIKIFKVKQKTRSKKFKVKKVKSKKRSKKTAKRTLNNYKLKKRNIDQNEDKSFISKLVKFQLSIKPNLKININFNPEKYIQAFYEKISENNVKYRI